MLHTTNHYRPREKCSGFHLHRFYRSVTHRSDSLFVPGKGWGQKESPDFFHFRGWPGHAWGGDGHAERKGRLEPEGWFLFLQVPDSGWENQEKG